MKLSSSDSSTSSTSFHRPEKIIVIGSSNQDLTSYSNIIPRLGQTVLGERFEISAGGKGANQGEFSFNRDSVMYSCRNSKLVIHVVN